jgi:ABC-type dipeptide/oligopeptide/nickel transport system ATPase component
MIAAPFTKRLRVSIAVQSRRVLFITHDLAVVRQVVDRLYVLYLGEIVESGATEEVMGRPQHPYTRRLVDAIPRRVKAADATM